MKATFRRGLAAILSLILLLSLAACPGSDGPGTGDDEDTYTLSRVESGVYRCEETGVVYHRLPDTYLPGQMSRKPYAVYKNDTTRDVYFRLGAESADKYLVLADEEDYYPYNFIVAEDYEMPTLLDMDVSEIWICGADAERFWADANVISKMRLGERVNFVLAAYRDGEEATLPTGTAEVCVQLIFRSETYTEFYYYCTYYSFGEGECYLYEFETEHCVRVPDGLFDGYALSFDEDA
ncbi:MAG: hypothetical protein IJ012_07925 [Clostridia bacterium]|nr:hypothetical protein [Clostridia bacterium]